MKEIKIIFEIVFNIWCYIMIVFMIISFPIIVFLWMKEIIKNLRN